VLRLKLGSRGQVGIQFNWMFVLIAGGVILAFFVGFIAMQKDSSNVALETTIAVDLDAIFTGARVSDGTATKVPFPNIEINVDCSSFRVGSASRNLENSMLFSPASIKGRNLITWSKSWNYPMKVGNFLYLTTDNVRYIFVCDSNCDRIKLLEAELPKELNKEVCDKKDDCWTNLEDQNNHHVRVVTDVDVDDNDLKKAFGEDKYSVFNIENKKLNNEEINIDQDNNELVYAAIFSENKEHYDCMMTNAMKKLKIISDLSYTRFENLENLKCVFWSKVKYDIFKTEVTSCMNDFNSCKFNDLKSNAFDKSDHLTIEGNNNQLRQLSCPVIY